MNKEDIKKEVQDRATKWEEALPEHKKKFESLTSQIEQLASSLIESRGDIVSAADSVTDKDYDFYDEVCDKMNIWWLPSSYIC